jgi:hypothetical protein
MAVECELLGGVAPKRIRSNWPETCPIVFATGREIASATELQEAAVLARPQPGKSKRTESARPIIGRVRLVRAHCCAVAASKMFTRRNASVIAGAGNTSGWIK